MAPKPKNTDMDELISDFSRFYILTILYEGPAHGYQIISRFKKRVKKEVSPSLVYPFLQQLEEKGLVKHTKKPVGEKQRKVFDLTKEGRELCTGLFKRFAELVAIAIEPSLYVCAHCGCKVYEGAIEKSSTEKKQPSAACTAPAPTKKRRNSPRKLQKAQRKATKNFSYAASPLWLL